MNKKIIIALSIIAIVVIIGLLYLNAENKMDSDMPYINSNINSANSQYNQAVTSINNYNVTSAQNNCSAAFNSYNTSHKYAEDAYHIAHNRNDSILEEYMTLTIAEIEIKMNATRQLDEGIKIFNTSRTEAVKHFTNANNIMRDAKIYSDKRKEIELQHPEKFIKLNK